MKQKNSTRSQKSPLIKYGKVLQLILLFLMFCSPITALAQIRQVWQDPETKINYLYTIGGTTAEVEEGDDDDMDAGSPDVTGDITILSKINVGGKEYTVTSIGDCAFAICNEITSVSIPNTVTNIGADAFWKCTGLTSINIPSSVKEIGLYAFEYCSNLSSVVMPNSEILIRDRAFGNTAWYNNQPEGLIYAGTSAYKYKGTMPDNTEFVLNNGTKSIADEAFYNCKELTSIVIPDGVKSIGRGAFRGCTNLSSITIPESVTYVDVSAFDGTEWYANQPEGVVYVGNVAYAYKSMGSNAEVVLREGTTWITSACFNGKSIKSLVIPEGVVCIDNFTCFQCLNLESVYIPSSLTRIGDYAFEYCIALKDVYCEATIPPSLGRLAFADSNYNTNATLHVPYGCKAAYEAASVWKQFKEIVEMTSCSAIIGSSGFATFCSYAPLDFTDISGLKAYIASGFEPSTGTLVLTRALKVPAGEGLYLVGDAGTYEVPISETDMVYSNLLKGVTTATTINPTDGSNTNFILANGSHGIGFYTVSAAGSLAAGKAYLQLPTASVSNVKAINFVFNGEETAVKDIVQDSNAQGIYNLQGQQVSAPRKGVYIINGKKVFIK